MGVVDQAAEDAVGDGGVADHLVPGSDGVLTGDEHGTAAVAVLEDLEEQTVLVGLEVDEAPVVDEQEINAGSLPRLPSPWATVSSRNSLGT